MATADGGLIAQSFSGQFVTFDQDGAATGMLAELPQLSWKGAYRLGSVDSVAPPPIGMAASWLAVLGGNLTTNGTAAVHHTIGLAWCGTGYGETDSCSGINDLAGADVVFGYEQAHGTLGFQIFADDHPAWIGTIEAEASKALKKAFATFPITVRQISSEEGTDKHKVE
jgi:hypothetical protein